MVVLEVVTQIVNRRFEIAERVGLVSQLSFTPNTHRFHEVDVHRLAIFHGLHLQRE